MSLASKTSTLEEFVESKTSSSISYQTFSLVEMLDFDDDIKIEFPAFTVLNDYYDDMKRLSVVIELTDEQYNQYKFRPKLLADYLYGNGELSFIILMINELISAKDFDLRTLKLISKSKLNDFLTLVRSAETNFIKEYNTFAN